MVTPTKKTNKESKNEISWYPSKQNLNNKRIYFDSEGSEIKIKYDETTGLGFVEIISE